MRYERFHNFETLKFSQISSAFSLGPTAFKDGKTSEKGPAPPQCATEFYDRRSVKGDEY